MTANDRGTTSSNKQENPRGTGGAGGTNTNREGAPPEFAPETGSPAFSKGGHGADDPGPGPRTLGEHDLNEGERIHHGRAQPPRR